MTDLKFNGNTLYTKDQLFNYADYRAQKNNKPGDNKINVGELKKSNENAMRAGDKNSAAHFQKVLAHVNGADDKHIITRDQFYDWLG